MVGNVVNTLLPARHSRPRSLVVPTNSPSHRVVGALNGLRHADDITYRSWATQLKDFRAVRGFKAEAVGLIEQPPTDSSSTPAAPPTVRQIDRPLAIRMLATGVG